MKRIVRLTESDLTRIVRRVIMEQDPTTTTGSVNPRPVQTTQKGVSGPAPVPASGVKNIKAQITIDCTKRLVTYSQLPKLPTTELNKTMNDSLINYYCQPGK